MEVESRSRHGAEVYHYRFKEAFGWAVFIVCEDLGVFSVLSDWGNGEYRWNPSHLGRPSLKEFLASTGPDYVMNKFNYEHRDDFKDRVDVDKTDQEIRRWILESRRGGDLEREEARDCWDEVDSFLSDLDSDGVDVALHGAAYLREHFDELYEVIATKRSARYRFFVDELLPFFFGELRKELEDERQHQGGQELAP